MSFAAMFSGFVNGVESGYSGGKSFKEGLEKKKRDPNRLTKDALEGRDNSPLPPPGEGAVSSEMDQQGAAPLPPPKPAELKTPEYGYAEGGSVDPQMETKPEDQSAAQYWAQEKTRAIATGSTPPADPIKGALDWFSNLGRDQAIGAGGGDKQSAEKIVREVLPAGGTHLDLTTLIGGISKVVGRQDARPFTLADHIAFLDRRTNLARERGADPNEVMKFNVQYIDNLRNTAQKTFALGAAAWDSGDAAAVQQFVKQGMGLVPDGLGVRTKFQDGKLHVQQFNEGTGENVGKPTILDKQGYMRMAGGLTGSSFAFGQYLQQTEDQRALALERGKAEARAAARPQKPVVDKAEEARQKAEASAVAKAATPAAATAREKFAKTAYPGDPLKQQAFSEFSEAFDHVVPPDTLKNWISKLPPPTAQQRIIVDEGPEKDGVWVGDKRVVPMTTPQAKKYATFLQARRPAPGAAPAAGTPPAGGSRTPTVAPGITVGGDQPPPPAGPPKAPGARPSNVVSTAPRPPNAGSAQAAEAIPTGGAVLQPPVNTSDVVGIGREDRARNKALQEQLDARARAAAIAERRKYGSPTRLD